MARFFLPVVLLCLCACASEQQRLGNVSIIMESGRVRLLAQVGHPTVASPQAFFFEQTDTLPRREVLTHGLGCEPSSDAPCRPVLRFWEFPETRLHRDGRGDLVALIGTGSHGVRVFRREDSGFAMLAMLASSFCESWVGDDGVVRILTGGAMFEVRPEGVEQTKTAELNCHSRVESQFVPNGNEGGFLIRPGRGAPGMICAADECPTLASISQLVCGADDCQLDPAESFGNFGYDGVEPQRTRIASFLLADGTPCVVSLNIREGGRRNYVPSVLVPGLTLDLEMDHVFRIGATATPDGLAIAMLTYNQDIYLQRLAWDGASFSPDEALLLDRGVETSGIAATSTADEVAIAYSPYSSEATSVRVVRISNAGRTPTIENHDLSL